MSALKIVNPQWTHQLSKSHNKVENTYIFTCQKIEQIFSLLRKKNIHMLSSLLLVKLEPDKDVQGINVFLGNVYWIKNELMCPEMWKILSTIPPGTIANFKKLNYVHILIKMNWKTFFCFVQLEKNRLNLILLLQKLE